MDQALKPPVTIVSDTFFPESKSTARILSDLAFSIADEFDVQVVTCQPAVEPDLGTQPLDESIRDVRIIRLPGEVRSAVSRQGLAKRAWTALRRAPRLASEAKRRARPRELVIVVTNPPFLPYLVSPKFRSTDARVVLCVHDFYPETLVGSGRGTPDSPLIKLWALRARKLYASVDQIVIEAESSRPLLTGRYGVPTAKIHVIDNYAEIDRIRPMPKGESPFARPEFTVQTAGNMGRGYEFDAILDAGEALEAEGWHFELVGDGAERPRIAQSIADRHLQNVTIRDFAPRDQVSQSLAACDLTFIGYSAAMDEAEQVPSRLYNILASGRAVVAMCHPDSELGRIAVSENVGYVVPPGDLKALIETLRHARTDPDLPNKGPRARQLAESRFSLQAYTDAWRKLLRSA